MRIRRIELQGFKSFAARTSLRLGGGISCIVGPNGSGKSNLVDAVRWTLGEQSAGTLRGRAMEDVVFAGSETASPAPFAEVTLVFDNSGGRFGGKLSKFAEIEVGRRLDRDGESIYLINRAPARLKDVVDLFLDTGVGARAYSIIEQGRVGFIVHARPDERRLLVEELAGIGRFKTQRAEAERRIAQTRENLQRAADLLRELGRHRKALDFQAQSAVRWRELRLAARAATARAVLGEALAQRESLRGGEEAGRRLAEARSSLAAEHEAARRELREADAECAALRARCDEMLERRSRVAGEAAATASERRLRDEESQAAAGRLARARAELAALETRAGRLSEELAAQEAAVAAARNMAPDLESRLAGAREREEAARERASSARRDVEAAKARTVDILTEEARKSNSFGMLQRQIDSLEQRVAAAAEASAGGTQRLDEARLQAAAAAEGRAAAGEALAAAEARLAGARSVADDARGMRESEHLRATEAQARRVASRARVDSLRDVISSTEALGSATARAVAELPALIGAQLLGPLTTLLRAEPGMERAVETCLGDFLPGIVVADTAAARAALDWARRNGVDGLRVLVEPPADPLLGLRLARDWDSGLAEWSSGSETASATADGLVLEPGRARWGPVAAGAGVLLRRRQLDDAETELDRAESSAAEALRSAQEAETALLAATEGVRAAEAAAWSAREGAVAARHAAESSTRDAERLAAALSTAARDYDALVANLHELRRERELVAAELPDLGSRRAAAESEVERLRSAAAAADSDARAAGAEFVESRAAQSAAAQALQSLQRELRHTEETRTELAARSQAEEKRAALAAAEVGRAQDELSRLGAEADRLSSQLQDASRALESGHSARDTAAERLRRAEAEARRLAAELGRLDESRIHLQLGAAAARASLDAARARAARDLDLDLDSALGALETGASFVVPIPSMLGGAEPNGTASVAALPSLSLTDVLSRPPALWDAESRSHAAEADALGPVNLAAPGELAELDGRHGELLSQRRDLERALADLGEAIRRIDAETRDRFTEAFAAVSRRFEQLYPRLVGGGRAELRLVDPADPLATGVEIAIEPPGKRLQSLSLLSGGEKAMAAIALLFAIFQVKPAPFCVLDEVDAPLDEANTRRFNAMLRELATDTQFVVITHNRTTMEVAELLHGVTMQRAGVSSLVAVRLDAPLGRAMETA
jgi:chromosome segregation protein